MGQRNGIEMLRSMAGGDSQPSQKPVEETLATRLTAARVRKSWTQDQLAARANTTQAVIQKIENCKNLRPRNIQAIANALDVDPSWLMFGVSETRSLSPEAIALAESWSRLPEPERSSVQYAVVLLSKRTEGGVPKHPKNCERPISIRSGYADTATTRSTGTHSTVRCYARNKQGRREPM